MKTKGALLWGPHQDWSVEEIEMGDPVPGEVTVRLAASGLCHSDEHLVTGDTPAEDWPMLGGHEGAGVIETVGEGVTRFKQGDHVVISAVPGCGHCPSCLVGHGSLCDEGARAVTGLAIADDTRRVKVKDTTAGMFCLAGTFAPYTTVNEASLVKVPFEMPLEKAALLGCGITTGWHSATRVADVRPGETVVVVGVGGLGSAALLASVACGAEKIVAIDPVPFKQEEAGKLGATHTFASMEEALEPLIEMTEGRLAHKVILTPGRMEGAYIQPALELTAKLGTLAVIGMGSFAEDDTKLNLAWLTAMQKTIKGGQLGGGSPKGDISRLVGLYLDGKLRLDDLITRRYKLEEINQGYQDMRDAKNLRGLIEYTDADH